MKSAEKPKRSALEAFDLLFNQPDYATAARVWSENYIQHSAPYLQGAAANLVRNAPSTFCYENPRIVVYGNWVVLHGRFSGQAALAHGLPQISCEWKAVSWRSIGMCCRTKPQSLSRRAACRYSVLRSQKQLLALVGTEEP